MLLTIKLCDFQSIFPRYSGRGGRGGRGGGGMQTLNQTNKNRDVRRGIGGRKWGNRGPPPKIRDASVAVRADWSTIEEMDFPRLLKLSLPGIKDGEDIRSCGALEFYDKTYDRINVKNERALQRVDRIFHTVTTTDDPVIRQLTKTEGNVYATDAILATIMCSTRSNYSWDIVIEKIGDKLFMDKRDNTEFDLLTVNETSVDPPNENGNLPRSSTTTSKHVILGTSQLPATGARHANQLEHRQYLFGSIKRLVIERSVDVAHCWLTCWFDR